MSEMTHLVIVDSGVGAISIADELIQLQLKIKITLIADSSFFPYGNKSKAAIEQRVNLLVAKIITQLQPTLIILGCNTISTLSLEQLRQRYSTPFIGVVPAVKPAASITKGVIGILATSATIDASYLHDLIKQHAIDHRVHLIACDQLVELAEQKLMGMEIAVSQITNLLDDAIIWQPSIDLLVLACTHFPLLKTEIKLAYPKLKLIDSGSAIARRAYSLLAQPSTTAVLDLQFLATDKRYQNSDLEAALKSRGFNAIEQFTCKQ